MMLPTATRYTRFGRLGPARLRNSLGAARSRAAATFSRRTLPGERRIHCPPAGSARCSKSALVRPRGFPRLLFANGINIFGESSKLPRGEQCRAIDYISLIPRRVTSRRSSNSRRSGTTPRWARRNVSAVRGRWNCGAARGGSRNGPPYVLLARNVESATRSLDF